jgi:hypothetical protein
MLQIGQIDRDLGTTGRIGEVRGFEVVATGTKCLLIDMFQVLRGEPGPCLCAQCVPKPLLAKSPALACAPPHSRPFEIVVAALGLRPRSNTGPGLIA